MLTKTSKNVPQDSTSINVRLLTQAGFIRQETAGVYTWLPLGLRVLRKIECVIREEMNRLGAQEILMPSLLSKDPWLQTGRWDTMDDLFKVTSRSEKEYALGATHEEIVTPLVQSFVHSYKDLPCAIYQIQTKFRDELRAKSGVLRGKEFGMKDMYSFHRNERDFKAFYMRVMDAYVRVFERCGLKVKIVEAAGGSFSKKQSHEFQVLTDAGEDRILTSQSWRFGQNSEVATLQEGDPCPDHPDERLEWRKGIEVGNIFDLKSRFSEAFNFFVIEENGERVPVQMGCYGIGTTRLVGAVVETSHDENGMIWSKEIAPFDVHLVTLSSKDSIVDESIEEEAKTIEVQLSSLGIEALWDDRRGVSAGVKFADADLIGLPLRILLSEKTWKQNAVEWKRRNRPEVELLIIDNISSLFEDHKNSPRAVFV